MIRRQLLSPTLFLPIAMACSILLLGAFPLACNGAITQDFCAPDQENNTLYGSNGTEAIVVDYVYEVEVLMSVDESTVTNDIIPALETAFAKTLLEDLFPLQCSSTASTAVEGIVGLSTLGVDVLVQNDACDNVQSTANACHVVEGSVTLYWDEVVLQDLTGPIQQILDTSMTNGDFLDASNGIVRVGMRAQTISTTSPTTVEETTATTSPAPTSTTAPTTAEEAKSLGGGISETLNGLFAPIFDLAKQDETARKVIIYSPFIMLLCCFCFCAVFFKNNNDSYEYASDDGDRDIEDEFDDDI
jgi:hypothetical protein